MEDKTFYVWHRDNVRNGGFLEKYTLYELLERAYYAGVDHKRETMIRDDESPEMSDPDFKEKNPELFNLTGSDIETKMKEKISSIVEKDK